MGASFGGFFANNQTNFAGLGAFIAANHPYNVGYYGYFQPKPVLTITGHIGSAGTNSGNGADGSVVISYSSSSVMGFALSPQAGTDASGNAYALGYTGPVNAFHPLSNPTTVETWQTLSITLSGWATTSGQQPMQYAFVPIGPNGSVWIQGDVSGTALVGSPVLGTLASGYRPIGGKPVGFNISRFAGTLSSTDDPVGQISTAGALGLFNAAGATRIIINAIVPIL
jgi:hypothetical protein